ncbi:hypothetical protein D3C87_1392110 [compost metagenome]
MRSSGIKARSQTAIRSDVRVANVTASAKPTIAPTRSTTAKASIQPWNRPVNTPTASNTRNSPRTWRQTAAAETPVDHTSRAAAANATPSQRGSRSTNSPAPAATNAASFSQAGRRCSAERPAT